MKRALWIVVMSVLLLAAPCMLLPAWLGGPWARALLRWADPSWEEPSENVGLDSFGLAFLAFSYLVTLVIPGVGLPLGWAGGVLVLVLAASVFPGMVFIPFTLVDKRTGGPTFAHASRLAQLAGWPARALSALSIASIWWLFASIYLCALWEPSGGGVSALIAGGALLSGLHMSLVGAAAAKLYARHRPTLATPLHAAMPRALRAQLILCGLLGVACLVALVALAFEPAPLIVRAGRETHCEQQSRRGLPARQGERWRPEVRLPGTRVRVSVAGGDVLVQDADGGGAGRVDVPGEACGLAFLAPEGAPPGRSEVLVSSGGRAYLLPLDDAGVRLDDGPSQRVLRRLSSFTVAGLLVTTLCWLAFLLFAAPKLREARTIHRALGIDEERRDGWVLVPGRLVALGVEGGRGELDADGGDGRVATGAEVETPGGRLSMPDPVVVWGGEAHEGAEVHVLTRRFDPAGYRAGAPQLSPDTKLVVGPPELATQRLVTDASRRASLLLAVAGAASGALFLVLLQLA